MEEKDELQKEIEALNQTKSTLQTEISQRTNTLNQLGTDILAQTTLKDELNIEVVNLTASRNNLNNEIATNTASRDTLQSEIISLTNAKSELDTHLAGTNSNKQTLESEITQRNESITQLDADIATRTNTRDNLNTEITNLTNTQTDLSNSVAVNTPIKLGLENEIGTLKTNKTAITEEITNLQSDKKKWEDNVKQWRDKYNLFSNDIAGISEDNSAQRNKYAIGIGLSATAAIICMCILVSSIKNGTDIPTGIKGVLTGNPRLLFLVYALMRISIVGSLFVLIFVFINLLRGFVSQYIRTQEKMSAVRLIDFLVSKIGKESKNLAEGEKIPFETAKMEKQNVLLGTHLPNLMEYNPSSFDKLSKTKGIEEVLLDLIKAGKISLPK